MKNAIAGMFYNLPAVSLRGGIGRWRNTEFKVPGTSMLESLSFNHR